MRIYFLLFFLSFALADASAQKIEVLSYSDDLPVPSAHLLLTELNSGEKKMYFTDVNGVVQVEAYSKEDLPLVLKLSFLGFETLKDTLYQLSDQKYFLKEQKITLNEVVITAQYAASSPEKAVHNIKIIDQKKIEAMGAQNLADVLSNEMNVRLSQDQVLGSSMSIQGISGQNIKILIDGVPVIGRLNGNIDLSQINMNNVERIEIIEGPLSVIYGTDALGGTVNIITKKGQKQKFSIASNNYYESNGQYNFDGKIAYQKKRSFISLSGGRNFFDGWSRGDKAFLWEGEKLADSSRHQDWKPKEQYFGSLYFSQDFDDLKLSYKGSYFQEEVTNKGFPRPPYQENAFDDYYQTFRTDNSLNLSGNIQQKYAWDVLLAYNQFKRIKNTYFKNLTNLQRSLTENPSDQDTTRFKAFIARANLISNNPSDQLNYQFGLDINHESAHGLRLKGLDQEIGDYALFATAEYRPFPKLLLRPGLRLAYNTDYDAPLVPSINMKYNLPVRSDNGSLALRFSYARGFRSPSVKELYFDFVDINHHIKGNSELKAEKSHNFNLSIKKIQSKDKWLWKNGLSLFYNQISNMVSLAQIEGIRYSYFNLGEYSTLGAQFKSEYTIQHFKLSFGAGYVGRSNRMHDLEEVKKYTYSPEAKCNFFYEWHQYNLTFAAFYKYTGKLPFYRVDSEGQVHLTTMQDYHTADLTLSKAFWDHKLVLSLGSKNIFDVTNVTGMSGSGAHEDVAGSMAVGMGRTYFLALDFKFSSK